MEIITKDGKDYLKTTILKINGELIECSIFFEDLKQLKEEILIKSGKTINDEIGYGEYGSNIQSILKRFSANYFSPSFMKGFMDNAANSIIGSISKYEANDATEIGTTVHKVFELYYKQDKNVRERNQLIQIMKDNLIEGQSESEVAKYINGYMNIKDYLDQTKELNDKELDCFCEYRGKCELSIPKFNISLPLPISYVVDRIDVRGDKLYVLDYKTGYQTAKSVSFDGYLGSMLLYKWVVEQDFGMEVAGGYLCTPGNNEKYIELNYSLVNESKFVDQIYEFYDLFKKSTEDRIYRFTNNGYFTTDDLKRFRNLMNQDDETTEFEVEVYIGEHVDESSTEEDKGDVTDGII